MKNLHFIDTNILIYSISRDLQDTEKRNRSIEILARDNGALSVQVLQEFYVQATRPTRANPISHALAAEFVHTWTRFTVQDITLPILNAALQIKAKHRFSYWDSAILASAQALKCKTVFTEDLSHGQEIDGMRIVNPFR